MKFLVLRTASPK